MLFEEIAISKVLEYANDNDLNLCDCDDEKWDEIRNDCFNSGYIYDLPEYNVKDYITMINLIRDEEVYYDDLNYGDQSRIEVIYMCCMFGRIDKRKIINAFMEQNDLDNDLDNDSDDDSDDENENENENNA